MQWIRDHRKLVIGIGSALVVALVAGIVWYSYASWKNGIRNEGLQKQNLVFANSQSMENDLSTCLDKGKTAAQVTQKEFDSLKDILIGAAAARYKDASGNETTASAALGGGKMFSAVYEQYPTIDTSSWKKLTDIVIGCRTDVNDAQSRIIRDAQDFKDWFQTGGVFEKKVRSEFPNEKLTAVDREATSLKKRMGGTGDVILTGMAAFNYLTRVISTQDAQDAMRTGTMPDQDLFGNGNKPTTTPSAPAPSSTHK